MSEPNSSSSVRFTVRNTQLGSEPAKRVESVALIWDAQAQPTQQACFAVSLTNYPITIDTGVGLGTKVGVEATIVTQIEFPSPDVAAEMAAWIIANIPVCGSRQSAKTERTGSSRAVDQALDERLRLPADPPGFGGSPAETPTPLETSEAILQFCVCQGRDSVCLNYSPANNRVYYLVELVARFDAPASPMANETTVLINYSRTIPMSSAAIACQLGSWIAATIPPTA